MKRKKFPLWGKIAIPVVIILIICFGILLYGWTQLSQIKRVKPEDTVKIDRKDEDFEVDEELVKQIKENSDADVIDPEEITWDDIDVDAMKDDDVANILLIGQDRREGQGRQRSDSMIICSINKKTDRIILSSVMRDLYVPIPGYSDNRINAAYQFGGMPLLDQVMEESLGIHIDGNIEVDFDGFIESMTQVGNLDIELNESEASYLNSSTGWSLTAGVNSMTPEQLLAYARTRYVGNSDWERTDRQRRVLTAAFDKVKGNGLSGLLDMAGTIFPNLTTDMTDFQIMGYIYTVVTNGITEIESYRIPVEGTYSCQTLSYGMEVLVPDLNANSKYLQEYIYGSGEAGN